MALLLSKRSRGPENGPLIFLCIWKKQSPVAFRRRALSLTSMTEKDLSQERSFSVLVGEVDTPTVCEWKAKRTGLMFVSVLLVQGVSHFHEFVAFL
jgi:hypothetical protein